MSALALSWSGGKDSMLALRAVRASGHDPSALLTTVTSGYERVSMHGLRRTLVRRQAEALGLPLVEVEIPPGCRNDVYEERMSLAIANFDEVAFGDLFLADIRRYREERLATAGKEALFPLWGRETAHLAREFLAAGFEAVLVCVDPNALDPGFAGRRYDEKLLAGLPPEVDPCGENGEFHTFVYAGPLFSKSLAWRAGDVVEREGFVYFDVLDGR